MRVLSSERKFCTSCMKEHDIDIVEVEEKVTFKYVIVKFNAIYEYCSQTDELTETEDMIRINGLSMKDAYRKEVGLLTSHEIRKIREKYKVSQKELSEILNWGMATITRYENHQIQDRAHDDVLRRIDTDPKWFLDIIKRAKDRIPEKNYNKYFRNVYEQYLKKINPYSCNFISLNIIFNEIDTIKKASGSDFSIKQICETDICSGSYSTIPLTVNEKSVYAY
ncbi:MAG TPA: type II toxin-antitoxin system MqsA family antitoxin [Clostridiaceae bacterium]|jgi:putative zinc finger/helix-turn-helix YgiT family protein|nr:type II toxin-antitoxin system MqsA family antitoxin [Clostridiaceae bacterium]